MTARRTRGLDVVRDCAVETPPAIHVLILDGIPRVSLRTSEVAACTGIPVRTVQSLVNEGRIRHIGLTREYVIPVSELAVITSWADYVDRSA